MVGSMQMIQLVRVDALDRKDATSFLDKWWPRMREAFPVQRSSTLTLLFVGCFTILFYFGVFRRRRATHQPITETNSIAAVTSTEENKSTATSRRSTDATPALRVPSHVAVPVSVVAENGSNILHDGLVAFRFTTCAAPPSSQDERWRRDRALLFARLWSSDPQHKPPKKGSMLVISIPMDAVDCPHQRYGLYLLATYYNVLVILVPSTAEEPLKAIEQRRAKAIATLRGNETAAASHQMNAESCYLSPSVLPTHRILASNTVSGRVAICRQLQSVDAILDYETEVQSLLTRFGHVVILYNRDATSLAARSEFGKLLL
jgi:hypothetical protein